MTVATTKKIRKFSKAQMAFHWTYGISWILLVLTGIIFLWRPDPHAYAGGFGPWLQGFVGQSARFIHRVAALGLMAAPLVWLLGDTKSLWPDLKELLAFGKSDMQYMMIAPIHYTTGKGKLPPQGKYNGGHKLNFYIVILTFLGFIVSGLWMWFGRGPVAAKDTFNLMRMIHSVSFWIALYMGLVHMYLTAIHPFTRRSLDAMLKGRMDLAYAKAEHGLWVEEQIKSGRAQITEEGKAS